MTTRPRFSRRQFLLGAAAGLAALAPTSAFASLRGLSPADYQTYLELYGPMPNERFPIPAVDLRKVIDPAYLRHVGEYQTNERPGTVIVDTSQRVLFLTLPGNRAIRYGVGVGREGFAWSGRGMIQYKKAWPTWTPPAEMIARQPELEEWRNGMPPGLGNPLGARALYIFENGRDTLYRLHGTAQPESIGRAVSSGCVRLINQDIIDLFNRVPPKTPIVVL